MVRLVAGASLINCDNNGDTALHLSFTDAVLQETLNKDTLLLAPAIAQVLANRYIWICLDSVIFSLIFYFSLLLHCAVVRSFVVQMKSISFVTLHCNVALDAIRFTHN